ncbi:MAG: hypothetical protein HY608_08270, partial [Planctomycetes bacterium]|nr:hypothetical protein [Planctomycetota bacterium]
MVIPVRRNRPGVREGGIVLVLVSLFLVLLASLALLLVAQTKFLRRIEWSGVTTVRAGLLARSGVERACMESRRGADPVYGGEDYNGDGAWDLSPTSYEQVGQSYRPALFDIDACPVEHALRPSFFSVHDEILVGVDPAPDVNAIDGKPRGFSGRLRGTYIDRAGSRGDTYALKVSLPDGLYVNGGDAAAAWSTGYNLVLAGILTNLAEAIDRSDGADDGVPVDKTDGTRLVFMRPSPGGWTSWDQIRTVALGDSQARLDALKPYLRLTSSVDRKVIAPTAPDLVGSVFTTWADYKMAHTLNGGPIPGPERVGANVVGRAPVYLGWARKQRPVLIALMANLSGIYIDETTATGRSSTDSLGAVKSATLTLDSAAGASWAPGAPTDPCRTAADALFNFAGPLDTWAQWEAFVNGIDFPGLTPAQEAPLQSLLKANFNPNGNLNKFNPNPSRWRPIDKSDMRTYSTEFSLFPQQTEIASAGRILDGAGGLLALRTVEADLAAPRILRIAAQSEFVCDDLGNWDRTGDENATPYRRPGYSVGGEAPFITQGTGDFYTWGQRIDMSGTYSGTWMTGAAPGTP